MHIISLLPSWSWSWSSLALALLVFIGTIGNKHILVHANDKFANATGVCPYFLQIKEADYKEPDVFICNVQLISPCVVYSIGIGNHWEFDKMMIKRGCHVYSFDPDPATKAVSLHPTLHQFHRIGISGFTGKANLTTNTLSSEGSGFLEGYDLMTLEDLMTKFGHTHLNILRTDVEGSEWFFLQSWLDNNMFSKVDQWLVEIHLWENRTHQTMVTDTRMQYYQDIMGKIPMVETYRNPNLYVPNLCYEYGFVSPQIAWLMKCYGRDTTKDFVQVRGYRGRGRRLAASEGGANSDSDITRRSLEEKEKVVKVVKKEPEKMNKNIPKKLYVSHPVGNTKDWDKKQTKIKESWSLGLNMSHWEIVVACDIFITEYVDTIINDPNATAQLKHLATAFYKFPYKIQQIDYFRYLLMYQHGGIYMDADVSFSAPLAPLLEDTVDILLPQNAKDYAMTKRAHYGKSGLHIGNWFMASVPLHPFWLHALQTSVSFLEGHHSKQLEPQVFVIRSTGPHMLGAALLSYVRDKSYSKFRLFCVGQEIRTDSTKSWASLKPAMTPRH